MELIYLSLSVFLKTKQIQLLADLNLKKTPQLVELVDDSKVIKFRISLSLSLFLNWEKICVSEFCHSLTVNHGYDRMLKNS